MNKRITDMDYINSPVSPILFLVGWVWVLSLVEGL